ncbi:hypothetical protein [Streptomyces sp. NPDC059398]|uniref:hypothetical protein n=1 Tax=Streptomyces sp. NPDC059398 TaxID=3346820 RepID=UPI0036B7AC32
MEHEVFVPVPAESVRRVLADPARVARCVPGLQQDADRSDPGSGRLAGRLRVRIDGHTITFRGTVRLVERNGGYEVDGEGTEARGPGSVKLSLKLSLADAGGGAAAGADGAGGGASGGGGTGGGAAADGGAGADAGTTLRCTGTARAADGRLAQLPPDAVLAAARRLLDRFGDRVRAEAQADASAGARTDTSAGARNDDSGSGRPEAGDSASGDSGSGDSGAGDSRSSDPGSSDSERGRPEAGDSGSGDSRPSDAGPSDSGTSDSGTEEPGSVEESGSGESRSGGTEDEGGGSVFEAEVPPPSLDPAADADFAGDGPPVEAAHARRTMIGRSAEEVDHAPPRGRYAPVPAPSSGTAGVTLRWAAPAAALALASAVVVSRALRRRR